MAKQPTNLNARLASLREEVELLKANEAQIKKIYASEKDFNQSAYDTVNALEAQNKILEKSQKQYQTLITVQNKRKKALDSELKSMDELDTSLISIGNTIGKNSKAYQFQSEKLNKTKIVLESISTVTSKNSKINDEDAANISKLLKAYKQNNSSILEANKLKVRGKITQSEYLDIVQKSHEAYADIRSEIELSADAASLMAKNISDMDAEINSFARTSKASADALKGVESSIDGIAGSGVEGVRELGDVLKTATNGGKGLALAMGALAGVAAGMAYNFGLIGDKLGTVAGYDKKIEALTGKIDTINKQVEMGMFGGRNFVLEGAMLQFNASLQQMGASFQAASKTALFGNKLGSVGYGAAQLQMAGISAENIAESMQAASDATGKMPTGKMAADMSMMAARTGQSTENIAIINETFQRLDKVSEKTALNLQEGVRAMADKAGVNLGSAMAEIAEASKDALSYQIKGSNQLAKQVIAAKSMGVSFNEVAKAGKSMVMNYKDSIKSEMQLSAMLGKNVDLSEVRAKFASGDTTGAMSALKAQGLDPAQMDMFAQEQLSQALGGLDLNSIQKIGKNTAKSGGNLAEGSAEGGNKTFLAAKQSAEAGLAAANAMISAATELKQIALNSDIEQAKQQAIIDNVGGIAKLMNERDQQGFLKNAETMLTTALISTVATVVTTFLMSKGGGLFGKLFSKAPSVAPAVAKVAAPTAAKTAAKATTKTAAKTAGKVGAKSVAKVGAKAVGKSLLKKIPVIGLLAGVGFGLSRLMDGDYTGAALELASGAAGTIPGIGTAASVGIDTALAAKDMGAFDKKPSATPAKAAPTPAKSAPTTSKAPAPAPVVTPTAAAAKKAVASTGGSSVTQAAKASEKWIQDKMTYMSGNLERVVDRTTKTMNNTAATTTELKTLNTNTKAIMNLTKTIEALTIATYEGKGNVSVSIDGKNVAYAFEKYKTNTQNQDPNK
jgi:hypothetical protein